VSRYFPWKIDITHRARAGGPPIKCATYGRSSRTSCRSGWRTRSESLWCAALAVAYGGVRADHAWAAGERPTRAERISLAAQASRKSAPITAGKSRAVNIPLPDNADTVDAEASTEPKAASKPKAPHALRKRVRCTVPRKHLAKCTVSARIRPLPLVTEEDAEAPAPATL
jgi:hypothetical protein